MSMLQHTCGGNEMMALPPYHETAQQKPDNHPFMCADTVKCLKHAGQYKTMYDRVQGAIKKKKKSS